MSLGRPGERDQYGRRCLWAGALTIGLLIISALLGPTPAELHELLLHTGIEGPTEILPNIDVIPGDDERSLDRMRAMPKATEGVPLPDERPSPNEDAEHQRTRNPLTGLKAPTHWTTQLREDWQTGDDDRTQQEMHGASQRSLDFVLETFVKPEYPGSATPDARSRVVIVKVAMYVDEQGRVSEAYIVESDGGPLFDSAVLEAVKHWRYRAVATDHVVEGFWDQQIVRFVVNRSGSQVDLIDG